MSQDGADWGVMPERALKTILGGEEQPSEEEKFDAQEFERKIREAPIEATSYDGCATACARLMLEALEQHPELREVPFENEYQKGDDGKLVYNSEGGLVLVTHGLHDELQKLYPDGPASDVLSDLTGFMWGWACNAVQNILGKPPVSNPAILTIGSDNG